jgi:signal transduction histidine kinase
MKPPESSPRPDLRRRCWLVAGLVFIILMATTVALWRVSTYLQRYKLEEAARLNAQQTIDRLVTFLNDRLLTLRYISHFYSQTSDSIQRSEFQAVVGSLMADMPGILAVVLTDREGHAIWLAPPQAMAIEDYYAISSDPRLAAALDVSVRLRQPAVTESIEIPNQGMGFLAVMPVMAGGRQINSLVGVFPYQSLLAYLLQPVLLSNYRLTILHGQRQIYPPPTDSSEGARGAGEERLHEERSVILGGQDWLITVQPAAASAAAPSKFTSVTILGLGFTLALALSFLMFRTQWQAALLQTEAHDSRRRLERTGMSLVEVKSELDLILNSVDEGIVFYDAMLEPIQANAAFLTTFNLTEGAMAMKSGPIHHEYMIQWIGSETKYWSLFNVLRDNPEQSYTDELERVPPPDGRAARKVFRRSAMTLCGAEGERRGVLAVYKDLTTIKAIDRVKDEFLSNVTHELRTPLASIRGFAETLRRDPAMPVETRGEFLSIMCEESARLQELIDELLDLRRMEANPSSLESTPYDLKVLVDDVARGSRTILMSKNLSAKVAWSGPSNSRLQGEVSQISRALRNLMVNAVKYSPEGGEIALEGSSGPQQICLEIRDQGQGIADRDLPHIFDRFYRGASGARRQKGTGLGLAIVKHIVERHGGHLGVRSVVGQGTTFRIELPRFFRPLILAGAEPAPPAGGGDERTAGENDRVETPKSESQDAERLRV